MEIAPSRHKFTVDDFLFLYEQGRFKPDANLELIEGEILEILPAKSLHAGIVTYLNHELSPLLFSSCIISVHNLVTLNDFNQPQPDVAIIKYRDDFYKDAHPGPSDVLLLIEVSDTTIELDRNIKFPKYASAGIPEAWLIDLPAERIEVHSGPEAGAYAAVKIYQRGEEISAETMPEIKFTVDDIFG